MGNVYLLDCTLRDGGYVNDWRFGRETIKGFGRKIALTGIAFYEIGFLRGDAYDPDRAVFPDLDSIKEMITPKAEGMKYMAMLDMGTPVPKERIVPCDGTSVDGIRVIFKKDKIHEAYDYCKYIQEQGYLVCVNFVGTDLYTDKEFIEGLEMFNELHPYAVSIVDSFGVIKRKQFLRLVYLADHNLHEDIILAYHAHNNLQQAFGNAESLVEMNLKRDLLIDACVFGMGRGAGNLNLELFAEYMNENYDTHYKIEPMLEIMDEYLNDIYQTRFWGYSLPLYLSAAGGCHPNYAIYLAEKDTLTVKSFNELLRSISDEDKANFSKERAEKYYRAYQENYLDDKAAVEALSEVFSGKRIILLAPGSNLKKYKKDVLAECEKEDSLVIALNFCAEDFHPDFIFSSNMRRFTKIQGHTDAKCITTSNMQDAGASDYVVNFASYASHQPEIIDNSGLMMLRLLTASGVRSVSVAGMDGYAPTNENYFDKNLEYDFAKGIPGRNSLISNEIHEIQKNLKIEFLTPTTYQV